VDKLSSHKLLYGTKLPTQNTNINPVISLETFPNIMRVSLVAFLFSAMLCVVVVQGQTTTTTTIQPFTMDVSVMWYNEKAQPQDCDDYETDFISKKIEPDLNLILYRNGYDTIDWSFSRSYPTANRDLLEQKEEDRELDLCDTCIKYYPAYYCNAWYNCGFRRRLRARQATASDRTTLEQVFTSECGDLLKQISKNPLLSSSCRKATAGSICTTIFL